LLFQVLRDDFLALYIRGCWLIGFLFTPIYMFTLIFVVFFGPKRAGNSIYANFWNFKSFKFSTLVIRYKNMQFNNLDNARLYIYNRLQFTLFTCRATVYVLFTFWIFFSFFGETLILFLFNFNSINDVISGNYFFIFKFQTIFSLVTLSTQLSNTIMFYICLFTCCAFVYLMNLRYTSNVNYLKFSWYFDLLIVLITSYYYLPLLNTLLLIFFVVYYILYLLN
jgi:hypothetical protein